VVRWYDHRIKELWLAFSLQRYHASDKRVINAFSCDTDQGDDQSLKAKRTILFFLLLSALIPTPLIRADPGWLMGWDYRKSHTLTGTAVGAQTYYQILIDVRYGSGVDADNTVWLDSKCQVDFDDIRFTTSNGLTQLDYWIESKTDNSIAVIWVEVDAIPASPDTVDIYIYYGNDEATTMSNGMNVFPDFFDHFDDETLTGWTVNKNPVESGTIVTITGEDAEGIYRDSWVNKRVRFRANIDNSVHNWCGLEPSAVGANLPGAYFHAISASDFKAISGQGAREATALDTGYLGSYQVYTIKSHSAGTKFDINDLEVADHTTNYLTSGQPLLFQIYSTTSTSLIVDWVFVAKYVSPEPVHTSWGSEQESPIASLPTKLFGAGFDGSTPYVSLYWTSNLTNIDFFEVQNSTDKITWGYLGQNTTKEYHDFEVVNGTERYYRIRACNFEYGEWFNSSFTDINFETVYFVMPLGNGVTTIPSLFPGLAFGIALFIIAAAYYYYQRR